MTYVFVAGLVHQTTQRHTIKRLVAIKRLIHVIVASSTVTGSSNELIVVLVNV